MDVKIKANLKPLQYALNKMRDAAYKVGDIKLTANPMRHMFMRWGVRYSAFARRRFLKYSRGGGDWPPLKASTLRMRAKRTRARRTWKKGKKRKHAILINTGQLIGALSIGAPGNILKSFPGGVIFGYGGSSKHSGSRVTIADIAKRHQKGDAARHLPRRQIIVMPDQTTIGGMKKDASDAVNSLLAIAERKKV